MRKVLSMNRLRDVDPHPVTMIGELDIRAIDWHDYQVRGSPGARLGKLEEPNLGVCPGVGSPTSSVSERAQRY